MSVILIIICVLIIWVVVIAIAAYKKYKSSLPNKRKTIDEIIQDGIESLGEFSNDPKQLVQDMVDAVKSELNIPPDVENNKIAGACFDRPIDGECDEGYMIAKNKLGMDCCVTDPKSLEITTNDKIELGKDIALDIAKSYLITEAIEMSVKLTGRLLRTVGSKLTAYGAKTGTQVAAKAAPKIASKMAILIGKKSGQYATKMAVKLGAFATRAGATAGWGPVGWAVLAFDVISMALDIWDPMGYNDWVGQEVMKANRNAVETKLEEALQTEGMTSPAMVPVTFEWDDFMNSDDGFLEFQTFLKDDVSNLISEELDNYLEEIFENNTLEQIESTMTSVIEEYNTEYIELVTEDPSMADFNSLDIEKKILAAIMVKMVVITDEVLKDVFDNDTYVAQRQCTWLKEEKKKDVKWVGSKGVCSLGKIGCDKYNALNATLGRNPDAYSYGAYTDKYRTKTGGTTREPIMTEKTYPEKVCMMSLLNQSRYECMKKNSEWNVDKGMCDFSQAHCDRYALKRKKMSGDMSDIHNCIMYPGQNVAEMIFGTTITRVYMTAGKMLADNFDVIGDAVEDTWHDSIDKIKAINAEFDDFAKKSWGEAEKLLNKGVEIMARLGTEVGDDIKREIAKNAVVLGDFVADETLKILKTTTNIANAANNLNNILKRETTQVLDDLKQETAKIVNDAAEAAETAGNAIGDGAYAAGDALVDFGEDIGEGVQDGCSAVFDFLSGGRIDCE